MMKLILVATLCFVPALAEPQEEDQKEPSLAELARRERDRRASLGKPNRTITNGNLKSLKGLVSDSTPATTAEADTKESPEKDAAVAGEEKEKKKEEKNEALDWPTLFREARLELEMALVRGRNLEQKMEELSNGWVRVKDGKTQGTLEQQLQGTEQEMQKNQQEVQEARKALQSLQNQARREGVSRGVIRKLTGDVPDS